MTTQRQPSRHYSVEDYLCLEGASEIKHEFYQGEIFAIVGASRNHKRVLVEVLSESTRCYDQNEKMNLYRGLPLPSLVR